MEIKIGVLLPRSDMFPTLSIDILNGIKLPFKLQEPQEYVPKFIIESIGNATDSSLLQKIEQMMLQDETDVIICFCGYFMLDDVVKLANAYKKPIIHISLGARVMKPNLQSPYLIYQTLNLCHTTYLSGKYAVENFGKKVAALSSFYDGGYHLLEAFINGVTDNGGEIVYNYVGSMDYKSESFQTMVDGIHQSQPDVLFALFSYKEGNKVLNKLISDADAFPIIANPLLTDESFLEIDTTPNNMVSVASWAFDEVLPAMHDFRTNYKKQYDEMPTIFGLLGEEIGTVLLHCLQNEGKIPNKIAAYLTTQTIVSPRSTLRYNAFNESMPASFKIRKLEKKDGHFQNEVIGNVASSSSEVIYKKMEDLPPLGWKNPYICT